MTTEEYKEHAKMQAYWWVNAATNGHALTRNVYHGCGGVAAY